MDFKLKIEFKGKYVQINLSGELEHPYDNIEFLKKLAYLCKKNKNYNILAISKRKFPIKVLDAYDFPKIFKEAVFEYKYRAAIVAYDEAVFKSYRFMEDFLANRALFSFKVFKNISEAKKWLLGEDDTTD